MSVQLNQNLKNNKNKSLQNIKKLAVLSSLSFGVMFLTAAGTAFEVQSGLLLPRAEAQENESPKNVEMTNDLRYSPETIQIQVGDTITWTNTSTLIHTVTADSSLASVPENVLLPQEAEPFNSGNIAPGQQFSHTFNVAGEYRYFCIPHENQGMVGTISVVAE